MKKLLTVLFVAVCATNSFAYYQAQQGRWISRDPIGERGGINIYTASENDPINRLDPYGLMSGSGGSDSSSATGSQCSHTIRVAHLFGNNDGSGNYDHYNSEQNDGSTCYVGCGMNELNGRQGENFPNTSAGTDPIPPLEQTYAPGTAEIISSNHGYTLVTPELVSRTPSSYDGDASQLDTISGDDIPHNVTRKLGEISTDKCSLKDDKGCLVCKTVSITIECPHGNADTRCGQTITINCE